MLDQVPERWMHRIRWILLFAWLVLIASLFFDPISPQLTHPQHRWSPLHIDPHLCIPVQGQCFDMQPYAIGPAVFWGIVLPIAILGFVTFGNELWRRICPLSFISQLPKAIGIQRRVRHLDRLTQQMRYETPKIKPDSWLGKNHAYLQFGLLYLGLCGRILFFNATRPLLAGLFLVTMIAAIGVGYLYVGKSWCHYFCPMAPVQRIYMEPMPIFLTAAHRRKPNLSQSMCRQTTDSGIDQSSCAGCQKACMDIDAERSYWTNINDRQSSFLYYAYLGLVVGYFGYYYLYAGNWDYYLSGVWAQEIHQLDNLLQPGFYLFRHPIAIPKLIAAPLTLGMASGLGYWVGRSLEQQCRQRLNVLGSSLSPEVLRHRLFTLVTFTVFHIYFAFGGRPFLQVLPISLQYSYQAAIVMLSLFWLYRNWGRSPQVYQQEVKRQRALSAGNN
jgi:hypothetical protein